MLNQKWVNAAVVFFAVLSLIVSGFALNEAGKVQDIEAMGVTNLSSLTLSDDLVVGGTTTNTGATTQTGAFTVGGLLSANGGIAVDSTAFTVADTSGNTVINGTLQVTGTSTLVGNTDVAGTLQFGSDNLYGIGFATANYQIVCGTATVTGTNQSIAATGLTTVTHAIVTMDTDPGTGAGDPFLVTVDTPSGGNVVVDVWQDDVSAATSGAALYYCAIGNQ